jgi:TetR/AcrR family transcriptional repressor of nem operon
MAAFFEGGICVYIGIRQTFSVFSRSFAYENGNVFMKKAEATRLNILQKAFELIYQKGYQTTSIDDILATTQVTKGAFYYHFKNKDEMGLAIINEILKPTLTAGFIDPLKTDQDPLDAIYNLMYNLLEMTPWNIDFSRALDELTGQWQQLMRNSIEAGKQTGVIRIEADAEQVTIFVMSGYWGIRNFGKLANSKSVYLPYLKELKSYLEALRSHI